jgi:hypothetical protein
MKKLLFFSLFILLCPVLAKAEGRDNIPPASPSDFKAAVVSETAADEAVVNVKVNKAKNRLVNSGNQAEARNQRLDNSITSLTAVAANLAEQGNLETSQKIESIIAKQVSRQETIEQHLIQAKAKKRLMVFFFGPDFARLKLAAADLISYQDSIKELNALGVSETGEGIQTMQTISQQIDSEITKEKRSFNLFGWLGKK